MKIIDLLNKIANGEEVPKKIRYKNTEFIYHNNLKQYYDGEETYEMNRLTYRFRDGNMLNDTVEILEEEKKIPKKIEYYDDSIAWVIDDVGQLSDVDKVIIDKLNDVIDYLKSKGDE